MLLKGGPRKFARRVRARVLGRPVRAFFTFSVIGGLSYLWVRHWIPESVQSYTDSVAGGVLASLASYALVQYAFLQRHSINLRDWLGFGPRDVWVIPTAILDESNKRYEPEPYYVMPPMDGRTMGVLLALLRKADYRYPRRRVRLAHSFDDSIARDNLALMCLPAMNVYSRVFLGLYHELFVDGKRLDEVVPSENLRRFVADEDCELSYFGFQKDGRIWRAQDFSAEQANMWKDSSINHGGVENTRTPGTKYVDYAIVLRAPNPLNPTASILLTSGIHGIGTYGAAVWVYHNAHTLLGKYGDDPQAHLLKVEYERPQGGNFYVDSEVTPPISCVATRQLSWKT